MIGKHKRISFVFTSFSLAISIVLLSNIAMCDARIKNPNVSGQFYTANPQKLSAEINKYLKDADVSPYKRKVDIVISPHAGYFCSGSVAAYGYKAISKYPYKTVVIIGPSHYFGFDGVSIWKEGGFKTPLGIADVDEDLASRLIASGDKFYFEPKAFDREHSVEVEIPFLQTVLKDFKIVPIVMGQASAETVKSFSSVLDQAIGKRDDVLIVVSSDMSHYHNDKSCRAIDAGTINAIKALDVDKYWKGTQTRSMEMCGSIPATVAMLYAKMRGLDKVDVLKYGNSSETCSGKDRVVGYSSILIYGDEKKKDQDIKHKVAPLSKEEKQELIKMARNTVEMYVKSGKVLNVKDNDPRLQEEEGAFVTLREHGSLRGCIGNILGKGPLYLTVRDMAIAAASQDPRFSPVKKDELKNIDVEISVLSKPWQIKDVSEIELGKHGVIVSKGFLNRGVFLPQVADETGWTKEEFLSELCSQKAHLPRDAWKDPKTKIEIFTADVFSEKDFE